MRRQHLNKKLSKVFILTAILVISGSFAFLRPEVAHASSAIISLSPTSGSFVVDSTFDVSVFLDTAGQSVNAVDLNIKFPADRLQLVSSSTGKSIIGIWATLPKFNNQTGEITLTGGMPDGITASHGLITTLTFRAKSVGSAVVKISDSKVLGNDGSGTEIPVSSSDSIYQIILPPPAGPVVVSETNPDQNAWSKSDNVSFSWSGDANVTAYSYMLSKTAVDIPDDISEGDKTSVVYSQVGDGRYYFHIKALRNGVWGGTTHYAVNLDATPPAKFPVEIVPHDRTSNRQPVIQFSTTDAASGVDHYEIKLIALDPQGTAQNAGQQSFSEASSPFVTSELANGKYDVVVRAYDQAENFTEETEHMEIVSVLFRNIGSSGLQLRNNMIISWPAVWGGAVVLILILLGIAILIWRRHHKVHHELVAKPVPDHLQDQLQELQKYRERYGKIVATILVLCLGLFMGSNVKATDGDAALPAPVISTINKNITNDELFYAGGFTGIPGAEVVLFLQNKQTGETQQFSTTSDDQGEWFYRHDTFLSPGDYMLWGQTKSGDNESPPSAQIEMTVEKGAFQFGSSRISLPVLYLIMIITLLLILGLLLSYIFYHLRRIRQKRKLIEKQVLEMEASIRRGFAVLNRDIQSELAAHRARKRNSIQDQEKEQQLLRDLEQVEQHLSKEIWELEES
ncbi:MAG TPA: cohesin domain-containing protein [Patescibacteria group bacterium]|nr:cohesin domain-containing protein [Patescibacteria group bacterium]